MEAAEGEEEVEEEASEEGEGVEDSEEDTSAEVRTEEAAEAGAGVAEGVSTRDYSNYYSRSNPEYLYKWNKHRRLELKIAERNSKYLSHVRTKK